MVCVCVCVCGGGGVGGGSRLGRITRERNPKHIIIQTPAAGRPVSQHRHSHISTAASASAQREEEDGGDEGDEGGRLDRIESSSELPASRTDRLAVF